jgi:hypothetical protein
MSQTCQTWQWENHRQNGGKIIVFRWHSRSSMGETITDKPVLRRPKTWASGAAHPWGFFPKGSHWEVPWGFSPGFSSHQGMGRSGKPLSINHSWEMPKLDMEDAGKSQWMPFAPAWGKNPMELCMILPVKITQTRWFKSVITYCCLYVSNSIPYPHSIPVYP